MAKGSTTYRDCASSGVARASCHARDRIGRVVIIAGIAGGRGGATGARRTVGIKRWPACSLGGQCAHAGQRSNRGQCGAARSESRRWRLACRVVVVCRCARRRRTVIRRLTCWCESALATCPLALVCYKQQMAPVREPFECRRDCYPRKHGWVAVPTRGANNYMASRFHTTPRRRVSVHDRIPDFGKRGHDPGAHRGTSDEQRARGQIEHRSVQAGLSRKSLKM